jgi:peroxidase
LLRMALALLLVRLLLVAAVATAASGVPVPSGYAGLAVGFYKESCPHAEELVLAEMREIVREDPTLGPALLRFMLHDCFVRVRRALLNFSLFRFSFVVPSLLCMPSCSSSCPVPWRARDASLADGLTMDMRLLRAQGCDGSIMLKSRNGTGERNSIPSYSLRGYDEIDQIKTKLEAECPLTVSCADIIVMAARDAVFLVTSFRASEAPHAFVESWAP